MTFNTKTVGQLLLIGVTAAIIITIFIALGNTAWGEGLRADAHLHDPVEGNLAALWFGQLAKQTVLMGIPALITLGVLRLLKRKKS